MDLYPTCDKCGCPRHPGLGCGCKKPRDTKPMFDRLTKEAHRQLVEERDELKARVKELEANLLDFTDAGAGNSIDLAWHRRAFDRARKNLTR